MKKPEYKCPNCGCSRYTICRCMIADPKSQRSIKRKKREANKTIGDNQ